MQYQVHKLVGVGGSGDTFRGELPDGTRVAVKELRTRDPRIVEEAARLYFLPPHPNVAGFLAIDEIRPGRYRLIQEWVEGVRLADLLLQGHRLTWHAAVQIASDVLSALSECVHASEIIHRDITPANIMVGEDGRAKLIDFGLARQIKAPLTRDGIQGTLHYLSPEQVKCVALDETTDLFALGAVLYEVLTGRQVFEGTPSEVQAQILRETPIDDPAVHVTTGLPSRLISVIRRLLAKRREDRYDTAAEVLAQVQELDPAKAGQELLRCDVAALRAPRAARRVAPRRMRWRHWMAAVALSVALSGGLSWGSFGGARLTLPEQEVFAVTDLEPPTVDDLLVAIAQVDERVVYRRVTEGVRTGLKPIQVRKRKAPSWYREIPIHQPGDPNPSWYREIPIGRGSGED